MQISTNDWKNYIDKLAKLNQKAASEMQKYVAANGFADTDALIDFCYALVTKYGEGSAELACQMYDAMAEMANAAVDAAVPAATATYAETARAVQGSLLQSPTGLKLPQIADRLVKQAAADTTLQNAIRDHAQWAWVPSGGETCGFCITLASNGWQRASKRVLRGNHATHIHANCDCMFAIRFSENDNVKGYDPDYYKKLYDEAPGGSSSEKVKALRRQLEDRDKINAQKRAAYAKRKPSEIKMSDADTKKLAELRNKHKTLENAMLFGSAEDAMEFKRLVELERATTKASDFDKLFNQQSYTEKQLIGWRKAPNAAEEDAIRQYTSSAYTRFNDHLRNRGYVTPAEKEAISSLHNYLSNQRTPEVIYLKRGYSIGNVEKHLGEFKNGDVRSIIGNTITDKGFVSTTSFEGGGFGGNVTMYIKAPPGSRGAYISDLSHADNEKEFLLDCDQNFIIRDARKVTNQYGFEVVEVFCEVIT